MNTRIAILSAICALSAAAQATSQSLQRTIPAAQSEKKESAAREQAQRPPSHQIRADEGGTSGADIRQNVDRSLTDLDAIRDKYINRASGGKCPPAIMSRMADLKWKLGQKGVAVSSARGNAEPGDFLAISQDWFKADDAPVLETRQASIDDIMPAALVSSQRKHYAARADDEDVNKMQAEYEALSAACSGPQQPAGHKAREQ